MKTTTKIIYAAFAVIALACFALAPMVQAGTATDTSLAEQALAQQNKPDETKRIELNQAYGTLPLSFEANQGQTDPRVKFLSRGNGYSLFLTPTEAVLVLKKTARDNNAHPGVLPSKPINDQHKTSQSSSPGTVLRMKLVGGNATAKIAGTGELPGKSNYLIGNDPKQWRTNLSNYAKVEYRDVYPGVDLVYYGNQRQLEHDFVIAPGADPKAIRLAFQGARKISLNSAGDLVLDTKEGAVQLKQLHVYQKVNGEEKKIAARYVLKGKRRVAFEVAEYDRRQPLVIDPVLSYSTYLGGNSFDGGYSIAADASGNAYVTGWSSSSNFPTTAGAFQTTFGGGNYNGDAFVTKLNSTGSALVYSTYLGASSNEYGHYIGVDASGNAYVTGVTSSTDFPTTLGAFQTTYGGGISNAFVTKLNPTGSNLVYSTYLGGNGGNDVGYGIALDASSNAYVSGLTESTNFPTTLGAFQTTNGGGRDAFVTKLDPTGSALVYSTYLGGSSSEEYGALSIALDASGNAYVTGDTYSTDFPTTSGAYQTTNGGDADAFVTELNSTGSALIYSTYLGGNSRDVGNGIALDASGNAYVTGPTSSINFPTTSGAFQTTNGGGVADAFVNKLNPTGSALVYSTYLGGSSVDSSNGIALDASGNAYVTGYTSSTNFPTTSGAFQTTNGGAADAFVTKLNPTGSALVYSTYLGGSSDDSSDGITLDVSSNAYVAGFTLSSNFPTTPGAFQTTYGGGNFDAFVAKFSSICADGSWTEKAPMPTGREAFAAAEAGGKIYAVGGRSARFTCSYRDTNEAYDPVTDTWSNRAAMPTAREGLGVGAINGIIYAVGGDIDCGVWTDALEAYDPVNDTWSIKAPMPAPRGIPGVCALNGILNVVGGFVNGIQNTHFAYDPTTDSWSTKAPMPTPRYAFAITAVGGHIYAMGGVDGMTGLHSTTVEIYDPLTDSWISGTPMPTERAYHSATVLNGLIYVVTGADNTGLVATVDVYDPLTDTWSTVASLPTPRDFAAAVTANGAVYVMGGEDPVTAPFAINEQFTPNCQPSPSPTPTPTSTATATPTATATATATFTPTPTATFTPTPTPTATFTPTATATFTPTPTATATFTPTPTATATFTPTPTATATSTPPACADGTWSSVAALPVANNLPSAIGLNGLLYAVGGSNFSCGAYNSLTSYDPSTNTWTPRTPMPTARADAVVGVIGGKIYAITGETGCGTSTDANEVYDPIADSWTSKASCPVAKYRASGGVINGLLYVVGGGPGGSPSSRTDVYDPLSDTWAPRAAMPSARSDAGSAVLNGILYVIGGEGDQGVLSSVEAYNPLMDTWAEKAPLPVALGYSPGMAATFNGRIYVAGGYNAADNELSNAVYVYDPTSDSWSAVSSMPTARQSDGVAAVGGKLYVLGGYGGNPDITAKVDAFTPDCSPTPTPSPTPTATATFTPTPTATATFTPTPTATATFTSTPTPTFTPTPTATATATATFTPTPTATATPTPTSTPTPTPTPTPTHVYNAQVQPPINADGSSIFTIKRGVVPVKFTLTDNGSPTCDLPPATIVVTRTAGGTIGEVNESVYSGSADSGSNFRIDGCQYIYNLNSSALGVGTYRVEIKINNQVVGSAVFQLK